MPAAGWPPGSRSGVPRSSGCTVGGALDSGIPERGREDLDERVVEVSRYGDEPGGPRAVGPPSARHAPRAPDRRHPTHGHRCKEIVATDYGEVGQNPYPSFASPAMSPWDRTLRTRRRPLPSTRGLNGPASIRSGIRPVRLKQDRPRLPSVLPRQCPTPSCISMRRARAR
jgi:hypothetical protein